MPPTERTAALDAAAEQLEQLKIAVAATAEGDETLPALDRRDRPLRALNRNRPSRPIYS